MNDRYPIPDFLRRQPEQPAGPRERPILFSPEMVRAILAGTKTQTRRALKVQPIDVIPFEGDKAGIERVGHMQNDPPRGVVFRCKFGQPGDRLYVKEKHAFLDVTKSALSRFPLVGGGFGPDVWNLCIEYCDGTENDAFSVEGEKPKQTRERGEDRWRPSIHMPRWASRILLEIVAIRVERLQDISEADCVAEGCAGGHGSIPGYGYSATPAEHYRWLWELINGAGSWDANPWVWCLTFKRV